MYDLVARGVGRRTSRELRSRARRAAGARAGRARRRRSRSWRRPTWRSSSRQSQNEIADLREARARHRARTASGCSTEDLDERFKDPDDPFRLVFVCAMWMTGFDVPSCSTIYLDRPMRNHTLMQTIARANRVFPEKENGLIVDYVGVFRHLEAGARDLRGAATGDEPGRDVIRDKAGAVAELEEEIAELRRASPSAGTSTSTRCARPTGFEFIALRDASVEALLVDDGSRGAPTSSARTRGPAAVRGDPARPGRRGPRTARSASLRNLAERIRRPRRGERPTSQDVSGRGRRAARPLGGRRGVRDPRRGRGRRRRLADRPQHDRLRRAGRAARRPQALRTERLAGQLGASGRCRPRGATRPASTSSSGSSS